MKAYYNYYIPQFAPIAALLIVALALPIYGECNFPCPGECHVERIIQTVKQIDTLMAKNDRAEVYYLYPYNMHLTNGSTSAEPLTIRDKFGNLVTGTVSFFGYDGSLISVDSEGYITALREESGTEIGTWVNAQFNGHPLANTCIVRVLSQDYGLSFTEVVGDHTVLWYPPSINGEDIEAYVQQYQIALADEYAYKLEAELMGLMPFDSARQILALDFGESEESRVCGISGNPIRLGWNLAGDEWRNCLLVPFIPPRSPQWFIFYHEIGHNFTWPSYTFGQGLGPVVAYSEGFASAISLETMRIMLGDSLSYPLNEDAVNSMQFVYDMNAGNFAGNFQDWLLNEAVFNDLDANIVDGLWLHYRDIAGEAFARRFFLLLQPAYRSQTSPIVDSVHIYGVNGMHTFFAALVSASNQEDLSETFANEYHYPIMQSFFDYTYSILMSIINETEFLCGDANSDDLVNISDAVFLINYVFIPGCPGPDPIEAGNVNCDDRINISDAVYLINYVFNRGSAPCDCP